MKKQKDSLVISAGDIKFISFSQQTEKVQKLITNYKEFFWMTGDRSPRKNALVEIIEQFRGEISDRSTGKILTKNEAENIIFNS